jgi:hypothetical protein
MLERDRIILEQARTAHAKACRAGLSRLWEVPSYSHERRAHRHKCQCCGKIVNTGEAVVMYRIGLRTRVVHQSEAVRVVSGEYSYLDLAMCHAYSHAIT